MAFGPLPPLDNSLFLARLQQQQIRQQQVAQEDEIRRQQARELAQATMAQEQHQEGLRNSEFERSLKLAQLQGETAGYRGEQAPDFANPERETMAEYGQAKTGFDVGQQRAQEARLTGTAASTANKRLADIENARQRNIRLVGKDVADRIYKDAVFNLNKEKFQEDQYQFDETLKLKRDQLEARKDQATDADGTPLSLAKAFPQLDSITKEYRGLAKGLQYAGADKAQQAAARKILFTLKLLIRKGYSSPDPDVEDSLIGELFATHKADFALLQNLGRPKDPTEGRYPKGVQGATPGATEDDDVDAVVKQTFGTPE